MSTDRIRVATYNIAGAINSDNRFYTRRGNQKSVARVARARRALATMATMLDEAAIDICALQEIDIAHSGSDTLDLRLELAERLGMDSAYAPSFSYDLAGLVSVTTGIATLGRGDLAAANEITFSQRRLPVKRRLKARLLGAKKALHTSFTIAERRIDVVNAHLTHDHDAQKQHELDQLLSYCARLDTVLLMGDLNTTPTATRGAAMVEGKSFGGDACMELLARFRDQHAGRFHCDARLGSFIDEPAGLRLAPPTPGLEPALQPPSLREICTYPADAPSLKLDYILLYSRDPSVTLGNEELLPLCTSNHRAVAAEVRFAE